MAPDMDEKEEDLETRRKRLFFRSQHRGIREMDTILGGFARAHLCGFESAQLDQFEALLEVSDPDIYSWITRREEVPQEYDNAVMRALMDFQIPPAQDDA